MKNFIYRYLLTIIALVGIGQTGWADEFSIWEGNLSAGNPQDVSPIINKDKIANAKQNWSNCAINVSDNAKGWYNLSSEGWIISLNHNQKSLTLDEGKWSVLQALDKFVLSGGEGSSITRIYISGTPSQGGGDPAPSVTYEDVVVSSLPWEAGASLSSTEQSSITLQTDCFNDVVAPKSLVINYSRIDTEHSAELQTFVNSSSHELAIYSANVSYSNDRLTLDSDGTLLLALTSEELTTLESNPLVLMGNNITINSISIQEARLEVWNGNQSSNFTITIPDNKLYAFVEGAELSFEFETTNQSSYWLGIWSDGHGQGTEDIMNWGNSWGNSWGPQDPHTVVLTKELAETLCTTKHINFGFANITLKSVLISVSDNPEDSGDPGDPGENPGEEPGDANELWTGNTSLSWNASYVSINHTKFDGVAANSKLKLEYELANSYQRNHIWISHSDGYSSGNGMTQIPETYTNGDYDLSSAGTDQLTLTQEALTILRSNGEMRIYGDEYITITRVSIIAPSQEDEEVAAGTATVVNEAVWADPSGVALNNTNKFLVTKRALQDLPAGNTYIEVTYNNGNTAATLSIKCNNCTDNNYKTDQNLEASSADQTLNIDLTAAQLSHVLSDNESYAIEMTGTNVTVKQIRLRVNRNYTSSGNVENYPLSAWRNMLLVPGSEFEDKTGGKLTVNYTYNPEDNNWGGIVDFSTNKGGWTTLKTRYVSANDEYQYDAEGADNIQLGTTSGSVTLPITAELIDAIGTSNTLHIQGQNLNIVSVLITEAGDAEAETWTVGSQYWDGDAPLTEDNGGDHIYLESSLLAQMHTLGEEVTLIVTGSSTDGSNSGTLSYRCASCGEEIGTGAITTGDPNTSELRLTDLHFTHIAAHNAAHGIAIYGNNVTVTNVSLKVVKNTNGGVMNFPFFNWLNMLRMPAAALSGYNGGTLVIDYNYDPQSDNANGAIEFDKDANGWGKVKTSVSNGSYAYNGSGNDYINIGTANGSITLSIDQSLLDVLGDGNLFMQGHHAAITSITLNAPDDAPGETPGTIAGLEGGNGANHPFWDFTVKTTASPNDLYIGKLHTIADTHIQHVGNYMVYHGSEGDGFVDTDDNGTNEFFFIPGHTTFDRGLPVDNYIEVIPYNKSATYALYQYYKKDGQNYTTGSVAHLRRKDGTSIADIYPEYPTFGGGYGLDCGEVYYITFDGPVMLTGIDYSADVPNITTDLNDVYSVSPGNNVELSIKVNYGNGAYYYQWYQNTSRSYVGAVKIPVNAIESSYTAHSLTNGASSYVFCAAYTRNNGWDPNDPPVSMALSKIAIINPAQNSKPTAPHVFYEYEEEGTKISLYNHANNCDIYFTAAPGEGTEPTEQNATVLTTYDGIHAQGSNLTTQEVTVKAFCKAKAPWYTKDSEISTVRVPVLNRETEMLVAWNNHENIYHSDPSITTMSESYCTFGKGIFECRGLKMTKLTHNGDAANSIEDADSIKLVIALNQAQFDPQRALMRINSLNKNKGRVKIILRAVYENGMEKTQTCGIYNGIKCHMEFDINPAHEADGWTESDITFPPHNDNTDGWWIEGTQRYELVVYAWGLDDGESIGLSNISLIGLRKGDTGYYPFALNPDDQNSTKVVNITKTGDDPVAHVLTFVNAGGACTAVSGNPEIVSVGTVENPNGTLSVQLLAQSVGATEVTVTCGAYDKYVDQVIRIKVNVTDDSTGKQYLQVESEDVVVENLTQATLSSLAWMAYEGYTSYAHETSINSIDPTTDLCEPQAQNYDMILLVPAGNTFSMNVKGAQSISFYTRGGAADTHVSATIDGDPVTDAAAEGLITLDLGKANMSYINLPDDSEIHTVSISAAGGKIYLYGLKISPYQTRPITSVPASISLTMDRPSQHYALSRIGGATYSFTIPDNPYAEIVSNEIVPTAQGSTVLNIHKEKITENGTTYRAIATSASVVVGRSERTVSPDATVTWTLSSIVENDGEYNGLYWDARSGKIADERDSSTWVGLNGLLLDKMSDIHFTLSSQKKGILTILYGPRNYNKTTSLQVNRKNAKDATCEGDDRPKLTQQSWFIDDATRISIGGAGDTEEGVINQIIWRPMNPDVEFPGASGENHLLENGNSVPTETINNAEYSLNGKTVYVTPAHTTLSLTVDERYKYVRKIVIVGTSQDEFDASYIEMPDCMLESGRNALPGYKESPNVLEFIPKEGTQKEFTIIINNQAALLGIYIYSFDYSRDITSDLGTDGRLGSICLNKSIDIHDYVGARFFEIAYKTDFDGENRPNTLMLDEVTHLEAGMPYIFLALDARVGVYFSSDPSNVGEHSPLNYHGLYGSFEGFKFNNSDMCDNGDTPAHIYDTEVAVSSEYGGIYMISSNTFKRCSKNSTVGANKAYIRLSEVPTEEEYNEEKSGAPAPPARIMLGGNGFILEDEEENPNEETVIQTVEEVYTPSDLIYDLNGTRVVLPKSGVFIKGNRIIMIK